ncbi:hypothetical protein P154DRAFT_523349 [Amniculicola lignicola CBS 123094]|uniref:Uncharacterized protein n=1 Tax=Amniculicola lignicola CBS 123094 TaxID=1392246 RepID=A0A6A5WEJ0_9PLEO|nr:hypothetical protein P154DRAFT_523349 [Amniculicola lignicola CBS 123094]
MSRLKRVRIKSNNSIHMTMGGNPDEEEDDSEAVHNYFFHLQTTDAVLEVGRKPSWGQSLTGSVGGSINGLSLSPIVEEGRLLLPLTSSCVGTKFDPLISWYRSTSSVVQFAVVFAALRVKAASRGFCSLKPSPTDPVIRSKDLGRSKLVK